MTTSRRNVPERDRLLTQQEAADRLGVSVRTVREYRFEGELPSVKLGYRTVRVQRADVERLIQSRTTGR